MKMGTNFGPNFLYISYMRVYFRVRCSVYFSKVGTFFKQNCLYIRSEIFSLA